MSEFKGKIAAGVAISIVVALGIAVAAVVLSPSTFQSSTNQLTGSSSSTSSLTTSASTCFAPGQPAGAFLRVISDSGSTPIVGARVVIDERETAFASNCGNSTSSGTTAISVLYTFTTNSTEWHPLLYLNAAEDLITVTYSGQTYNFTMPLGISVYTCGTIYIPSGTTNITASAQGSCASTTTRTTSTSSSTRESGSLTWYTTYGDWNYSVTLSADMIRPGQNITIVFMLTNISNQTQKVDIDGPLVLPTIYTQSGTVVWAYQPPSYNEIENVTAGQTISQELVLPTWMLGGGQSYTLSSYPGIGTPDFVVNIGPSLQLNQTITVA